MNPMKLILLGVGGYFLIKATGISIPGFSSSTSPNNGGSEPATGGGTPPPASTPAPPPVPISGAEREALIRRAASGDAAAAAQSAAAGIKLGADAWNWYREQATGVVTTADLFTEGNRGELIDAPTYLSRRLTAGLGAVIAGVRRGR
jgi:hypothetical protein